MPSDFLTAFIVLFKLIKKLFQMKNLQCENKVLNDWSLVEI